MSKTPERKSRGPAKKMRWLKRHVKIAVSLVYFISTVLVRGGLRIIGRSPGNQLVVLYYHGVPAKYRRDFRRQMEALQRSANVVPASQRGSLSPNVKHVAITFDDAFESLIDNALPELAVRSFHATIFVPVASIGRPPSWATFDDDLDPTDPVMTVDQLNSLASPLVSLGSHTMSHSLMTQLDKEGLWQEVEGSRKRLAELSGQVIDAFSFPYGDYNATCVAACKAAGYEFVFSILPGQVNTAGSEILRGRIKVDPSDGPIEFFLKFSGGYGWLGQIAKMSQRLLKMGRCASRSPKRAEPQESTSSIRYSSPTCFNRVSIGKKGSAPSCGTSWKPD